VIMHAAGGEIVSPCVAMPLWIEYRSISLINQPILIHISNVVVEVVGRFAEPLDVVPEQPVVGGIRFQEVSSPQQGQLLLQQRGHLVLKRVNVWIRQGKRSIPNRE